MANSDQFVEWNSNECLYAFTADSIDGGIVTFESTHPKWSFAKLGDDGFVSEVAEKKPISNIATVGIYYWKQGSDYVKYAEQMIANNERYNGEFYIGPTYNYMIKQGYTVGIHHIPNEQHNAVGIPRDLTDYINRVYANESSSTG